MPDSTADTIEHIKQVDRYMYHIRAELAVRALAHDASKLDEPEKSILDAKHGALRDLKYGTPAYTAAMQAVDMQPFLAHHYAHNDHHPQFHEHGIAGMSLLSLCEMLCDWKAAGERMKDGDIYASLAHNRERYHISDQLYNILVNTVKELGW